MRVIPARSEWLRREHVAAAIAPLHHGRAFLMRSVHFGRDEESVPVNHFRFVSFVEDVHRDGLAFRHAQQRGGGLAVVDRGFHREFWPQFEIDFGNSNQVIGQCRRNRAAGLRRAERGGGKERRAERQNLTACEFGILRETMVHF